MARPIKYNAVYFSHDADMRNDIKIKALRNKFKVEGYGIWCMLLEVLTDSNYFEYEWNEVSIEMLAADFNVSSEFLKELVNYCILIKLLTIENEKLLSENHKARFEPLFNRRKRERKLPEPIENSTPTKRWVLEIDEVEQYMLNENSWVEIICMQNKLSREEVEMQIKKFVDNLKLSNVKVKPVSDLFSHFSNWYNINKSKSLNGSNKRNLQQTISHSEERLSSGI